MQKLVSQLSVRLIFKQLKVATVESCTGGWIGKALTDQAGSSQWYAGGLVTYSNQSKQRLVNVPADLLDKYGAVSSQVAEAMALGAQQYFDHCVSVAVTGIAGPDGGSSAKPVGTVFIATGMQRAGAEQNTDVKQYHFKGDREAVRRQTVEQALLMLMETVERS